MKPDLAHLAETCGPLTGGIRLTAPIAPGWVASWIGDVHQPSGAAGAGGDDAGGDGIEGWSITRGRNWSLIEARCPVKARRGGHGTEEAAHALYTRLHALLKEHGAGDPVRFWNYIPDIHAADSAGCDRYMAFNAGRHRAFEGWHRSSRFQPRLVAASAVGTAEGDLIVHVLAGRRPAVPLENPRQTPAYRYSRRYGPVPPSFARASLLTSRGDDEPTILLTAGTASVVGEETRHADDLDGQLGEIERNLAALIDGARMHVHPASSDIVPALPAAITHLRAYVVRADDEPMVLRWLRERWPAAEVELMPAPLCRRGLLVELEAVAAIGGA